MRFVMMLSNWLSHSATVPVPECATPVCVTQAAVRACAKRRATSRICSTETWQRADSAARSVARTRSKNASRPFTGAASGRVFQPSSMMILIKPSRNAQSSPGWIKTCVVASCVDVVTRGSTMIKSAPLSRAASARLQPLGMTSIQPKRLTAGSMPISRKHSQSSTSVGTDINSQPNISSCTTCRLFWSREPTQKRLPVPIAASRPLCTVESPKLCPRGLPW